MLQEIKNCRLCAAHLPMGPRPVLQVDPAARILIAGQAPGRRVHESGVPFDDPSGDRLRAWLGVDRNTFYDPRCFAIVPMGFCYPGTGKSGDLPPRPECAEAWRAPVLALLANVQLTLILGTYALKYHTGQTGPLTAQVKNWRQSWPHRLVLPHPSPRNNRWLKQNPWFEAEVVPHLQSAVSELRINQAKLN
nr:uracil-DNA glycosylase family protein [Acanthopleuribacter pedis]